MFETTHKALNGHTHKYWISTDGAAIPYAEAIRLWQHDAAFRAHCLTLLAASEFTAYRWETPSITTHTVDRPFEFVLCDAPELIRTPDRQTFARYFPDNNNQGVAVFGNLSNDATLIVPCPGGVATDYSHLAAFVRTAPARQQHALLRVVASTVNGKMTGRPLWISTAGDGVAWLHVRLDSRPKYYTHDPYRMASQ